MTGYQSKKTAALDEDGMYLVHQTNHSEDNLHMVAQPAQEPDVVMHCDSHTWTINNPPPKGSGDVNLYYAAQPAQERNFCERCGKRTADLTVIHTCTPPQENT